MKKNLGRITHISTFLLLQTLDQMYTALVRSHLDYCDIIYHFPFKHDKLGGTLNSLMENVERIPYKAALTVTGTWVGDGLGIII